MGCTYAKDFIAQHSGEFFSGGVELRMQLVMHLQGCPDCQAHIAERVQPVLDKVKNSPEAAKQAEQVFDIAEEDFKKTLE